MQSREIVLAEWGQDDAPLAVRTASDARTESKLERAKTLFFSLSEQSLLFS